MFTGIVEELGTVRSVEGSRATVDCRTVTGDSEVGASVAVNGVCLTVVDRSATHLAFDLSEETLARSALSRLADGDRVNLERPVTMATRLGGHLVQGHVDGVGEVVSVRSVADGAEVRFRIPRDLEGYVVEKGSITLDGVSLTIAGIESDDRGTVFGVALIPHTLAATTFGGAGPGVLMNVEVDVIAKYVERLLEGTA